jgi:ribulose bisphosphate carboxylase small subunit
VIPVLRCGLLLLLCGTSTVAAGGTLQDIPTTHRVILKEDWKPTPEQTQRALREIQSYLEHPRKGYRSDPEAMQAIREIFSHPSQYYVQFVGRYPKGRKAIFCNFVTLDRRDEIAAFRKEWFWASDGGSDFWHIWYEPDKNECSGFTPNPCCPRIRKSTQSPNKSLEPTAGRRDAHV